MKVKINGKEHNFETNPSINEIINKFNLQDKALVVEHNGIIIYKENYSNEVNDNDRLEIVSFVGGG